MRGIAVARTGARAQAAYVRLMRVWLLLVVGVVLGGCGATVGANDGSEATSDGGVLRDGGVTQTSDAGTMADVAAPADDAACNEKPNQLPAGDNCFPYESCPRCPGTIIFLCAKGTAPALPGLTDDNSAPTGYSSTCGAPACTRFTAFDYGQPAPGCSDMGVKGGPNEGRTTHRAYACPLSDDAGMPGCDYGGRGEGYSIGDNTFCCH